MTQKATVMELQGKYALVTVRRSSMCEGCEKNGGCGASCTAGELLGANKTMTALAANPIGAKAGDLVEISSENRTVLSYAALVFLFPILLCAAAYAVGTALGAGENAAMIWALGGFVLSFVLIIILDRLKKKYGSPDIRITRILRRSDSGS